MRKIFILGAGAGGTIGANMLRKELKESEWQITIIDRDTRHLHRRHPRRLTSAAEDTNL